VYSLLCSFSIAWRYCKVKEILAKCVPLRYNKGISKEVLKLCDEQLAIPLIGRTESLNVSAAAAIMLFEVVRQRIGD
jgi:hypothetical protein